MTDTALDERREATVRTVPSIPPKVGEAINAVMSKVRVLQKGDKNTHAGYMFASIDKFLEVVGGVCAEAGLIIMQDEVETEIMPMTNKKGEPAPWLRAKYEFWLAHSSGEIVDKPFTRSVMVQATGGQAFGSAQSYALKQFQRSLFQIATGDKDDVDFLANDDIEVEQKAQPQNGNWHGPLKKTAFKNKVADLNRALTDARTSAQIADIETDYADVIEQMKLDKPIWWDGGGDIVGIKTKIAQLREELPEYAESSSIDEAHLIPVPPNEDGNGSDWARWASAYEATVDQTETLEWLNAFVDANAVPFRNLAGHDAGKAKLLDSIVDSKRSVFVQAPPKAA